MRIRLLFPIALFFLMAGPTAAQNPENGLKAYTLIFRGTPIEEAIKTLVQETSIDLIYDPAILNSQKVFSTSQDKTPEDILADILKNTDLDYIRLSSGTYVLIQSAQSQSQYGSLAGIVLDKQTGKPLEGANVLLADASTGTSTNKAGRFTVAPLLTGIYEVTVTYVGYKPTRDTISIPEKSGNPHRFYLESRPVFVEPLVVSSIQRRLPHQTSAGEEISALTEPLASFTGSPDAIRSINSVMGVDFSLPNADFNVQGGDEGEHQVLLDGVPIYNPVSFGRLTGAFSPYALRKITIHKAGFPASVGSQLSGIINVEQDIPAASENNLTLQADPLNLNARINNTVTLGDDTEIKTMVAARDNIWNWYQKPSLAQTLENWDQLDPLIADNLLDNTSSSFMYNPTSHRADVNFYDLHFANQITSNEFHTTSLSFYRGKNYLQTQLLAERSSASETLPAAMYTQDTYDWQNTAARAEHYWLMSSRLSARFGLSLSKHHSNHHFGMANTDELSVVPSDRPTLIDQLQNEIANQPHTGDENFAREISLTADFEYSLRDNHKLSLGVEPKFVNYAFQLSDLFYHFSSSRNRTFMLSGYLEDTFNLNYHSTLRGGSRFTYVPDEQKIFAEPRLSLQVDYPETKLGFLSLKIATGLYRQFINQFDVTNVGPSTIVPSIRFWVPIDYTTKVPKSYHLSTELLLEPDETWSFNWESFYKRNPTILALDYHALLEVPAAPFTSYADQNRFIVQGESYSFGTGLSVEKLIESLMMELTVSYQYSVAKRRIPKRFGNEFMQTPWNEPHQLAASVNWKITSTLMTSFRWHSTWGRSWAYNRAYYDYLTIDQNQTQFGSFNFRSPSDDNLSPFHQLDAGISYLQKLGAAELNMRLNLINILDRRNRLEKRLAPSLSSNGQITYEIQEKKLPGFIPTLSFQIRY